MDRNLLLEIGTEEIPSRFIPNALKDIAKFAEEEFAERRIEHGRIETMGTPRRLVLTVRNVAPAQSDLEESFKGPAWKSSFDANGVPTKAAEGFAKSRGVSVEDLEIRKVGKVDYAFAVVCQKGQPTDDLLPEIMKKVITRLVFPKNMYWYDPSVRFARPIRWLLCLMDDKVVDFDLNGLKSGRISRGHRFMGAPAIEIANWNEYMTAMYDNYVIADAGKRKEKMISAIRGIEQKIEGVVELDQGLVQENLFLVEYPVPFYGSFDKKYLEIPEEVLVTSMKDNQKYFAVRDHLGELMPYFVGISNNLAPNMELVREGNERVLRARLEDAVFFWREDLKKRLSERVESLKDVIYQEKLGSVFDKVTWMVKFSNRICEMLGLKKELPLAERAAFLSKSDLVTSMVGEFPELQGIMGHKYALKNGEDPRVAQAIEDQYLPRFAGDKIPTDTVGAVVGLAERFFNMVGAYKAGFQPTGSQDPYGLRRAIRCINEILWGLHLDLNLKEILTSVAKDLQLSEKSKDELFEFVRSRTLVQLKEKNFPHDLVELSLSVAGDKPLQALRLLNAYAEVQGEEWFAKLATAAGRVKNILAKTQVEKFDIDESLFVKDAERNLSTAMQEQDSAISDAVSGQDWNNLMAQLAKLSPSVTAFFDDVMVMDDDLRVRANRLALLSRCNSLFMRVGDLSKVKR